MSRLKTVGKIVLVAVGVVVLLGTVAVGYAAATGERKLQFADTPAPAIVASTDSAVIEQGRYLVQGPAHCSACHSGSPGSPRDPAHPEMINQVPLAGGFVFAMGPMGTRYARNLTPDSETGIGRYSDEQVARAIRTGVLPNGELSMFMRFSASNLSDEDLTAVISYLRSLEPVRNEVPPGSWALFGKVLMTYAFGAMEPRLATAPVHVSRADEPSVERGEYLADNVMLCTSCHTINDMATFLPTGPKAGGGLPEASHGADSDMEFVAPNLTSHATGMTGKLSEDVFVTRLKAGRVCLSSIMPWENFGATTDSDLRSVYRYLRSLPPVENDVGPTYRPVGWKPGVE